MDLNGSDGPQRAAGVGKKNLLIAVTAWAHAEDFPCGSCECVNGEHRDPGRWEIPGEPLFTDEHGNPTTRTGRCLMRMVSARSAELLRLYQHYQNGHLLNAGGVADQPALYLEAMQLIQARLRPSD